MLVNRGATDHEFVVDTPRNNGGHAAAMLPDPERRHSEANARRLAPGASAELLWRFAREGTFEFACLTPGHYEAGMRGTARRT